jgi:hypothetical protein
MASLRFGRRNPGSTASFPIIARRRNVSAYRRIGVSAYRRLAAQRHGGCARPAWHVSKLPFFERRKGRAYLYRAMCGRRHVAKTPTRRYAKRCFFVHATPDARERVHWERVPRHTRNPRQAAKRRYAHTPYNPRQAATRPHADTSPHTPTRFPHRRCTLNWIS